MRLACQIEICNHTQNFHIYIRDDIYPYLANASNFDFSTRRYMMMMIVGFICARRSRRAHKRPSHALKSLSLMWWCVPGWWWDGVAVVRVVCVHLCPQRTLDASPYRFSVVCAIERELLHRHRNANTSLTHKHIIIIMFIDKVFLIDVHRCWASPVCDEMAVTAVVAHQMGARLPCWCAHSFVD